MPSVGGGDDGAVSDVHRREQARSPVTEVVVSPLLRACPASSGTPGGTAPAHKDFSSTGTTADSGGSTDCVTNNGSFDRQTAVRWGLRPNAFQPADCGPTVRLRSAIFDRTMRGISASVRDLFSDWSRVKWPARVPRPDRRTPPLGRLTPGHLASVFASPLRPRRRADSAGTNSTFGRPVLAIPHTDVTANCWRVGRWRSSATCTVIRPGFVAVDPVGPGKV